MLRLTALLLVLAAAAFAFAADDDPPASQPDAGEWISLFNGKDLNGWTPKFAGHALGVNFRNTFRVEDGAITVNYDEWDGFNGEFGHLFFEKPFSHYRLRMEYRFTGDQVTGGPGWAFRNSGVMLHGQPAETIGVDQSFPVSIEAQMLGGDGTHERATGNLCTPGTHVVMKGKLEKKHCVNSSSGTFHGDVWVKFEVEVHGSGIIRHFIDGKLVLEYEQSQLDPIDADAKKLMDMRGVRDGAVLIDRGTISLQAESHPCAFRKIELMVLPVD